MKPSILKLFLNVWILVIKVFSFKINKQTTETPGAQFPQIRYKSYGNSLGMQLQIAT